MKRSRKGLKRRYGHASTRGLRWQSTTNGIQARTSFGTWFIDDSERPNKYVLDWYSATHPAGGVEIGRFTSLLDAKAKAADLAWRDRHLRGR